VTHFKKHKKKATQSVAMAAIAAQRSTQFKHQFLRATPLKKK
jgi:hypothetical protein